MTTKSDTASETPPPFDAEAFADVTVRLNKVINTFLTRHVNDMPATIAKSAHIGEAYMKMMQEIMNDPTKMMESQVALWQGYMDLWHMTTTRMMGGEAEDVFSPDKGDKRFHDPAWTHNAVFDHLKQSYLMTSNWLENIVSTVDGLDPKAAKMVNFYTRYVNDALSPTNFALTNPQVLKETAQSGGQNLVQGLQNLLEDFEESDGSLKIKMTDKETFEVGENIAATAGKVVYRNAMMELIQYAPLTDSVYARPLLIIPPWINKFYILDMQPKNSFIRWATEQGLTVFIISWVNPDSSLAEKDFADYMKEGPLAAMDAITDITDERSVNIIGYCIGGTLLASMLAWIEKAGVEKWQNRVQSATFFTTMLDFSEPGDLGVFIDEEQVSRLEETMSERGYLDGSEMAGAFNTIRANDLVWSFVINNYMMGKEPFPFDLLYWNADSTRMPKAMHSFYLRKMYMENKLCQPNALELDGVALDLGAIKTPIYMISAREDHIAPWESTYAATRLFGAKMEFVLSASGHIAGIVNPPTKQKYCYWTDTSTAKKYPKSPADWLEKAVRHDGSWWPHWAEWVTAHGGVQKPARIPHKSAFKQNAGKPLDDAPGTYVNTP